MLNVYQKRISEDEVERLLRRGRVKDDRVGIFIMKIVGSHKSVNDYAAKRFQLTYDELVSDGSFFVLKYIRKFNRKRGRLSTYIYQLIGSFLKVHEKKLYRVQRRIPPSKSHSFHRLEEQAQISSRATLENYRSVEAMFIRIMNAIAVKLHDIELEQAEFKIACDQLSNNLPKVKKVLELYNEGYNREEIETKLGKDTFEISRKEFLNNMEILENTDAEFINQ